MIIKAKFIKICSPEIHSLTDFQEVLGDLSSWFKSWLVTTWPHNWSGPIDQRYILIINFMIGYEEDILDKMFNLSTNGTKLKVKVGE